METIYQSSFQNITFYDSKNFLQVIWDTSKFLSNEEYKKEVIAQVEAVEKYKPHILLIDTSKFEFTIRPKLQEWSANEVFTRVAKAGTKQVALIVPENIFAKVSIQQNIEEDSQNLLKMNYFQNLEEAIIWIHELY